MRLTPLIFVSLVASLSVFADWTMIKMSEFSVDPYPIEGSSTYRNEIESLLHWQKIRTADQCAAGSEQKRPSFESFYATSGILSASEVARYSVFVNKAMNTAARLSSEFKDKYTRTRPYNADQRIKPCIEPPKGNTSFPSTHATMATMSACVLSMLVPTLAEKLIARGQFIADLRLIVGVHYPSDVATGKRLGIAVCRYVSQLTDFREELEKLQ